MRGKREDTSEEIKKCLNCTKKECNNCIYNDRQYENRYGSRMKKEQMYYVQNRETGEIITHGTAEQCALVLGIHANSFLRKYYKGGTEKYKYRRDEDNG